MSTARVTKTPRGAGERGARRDKKWRRKGGDRSVGKQLELESGAGAGAGWGEGAGAGAGAGVSGVANLLVGSHQHSVACSASQRRGQ
eukprot:98904-Hanusia_phi.AAC.1